ncbi:hypothetical protein LCGC14_0909200 [marine sediment metagenome]|uniref:Uncharacterized protein n=1 Tax=marine sediment metagenome TaxID=412755 RepID=A0A0F9PEU4_9ZZZZ
MTNRPRFLSIMESCSFADHQRWLAYSIVKEAATVGVVSIARQSTATPLWFLASWIKSTAA